MMRSFTWMAFLILPLAWGRAGAAEATNYVTLKPVQTNVAAKLNLTSFQMVADRNIFNPNRRPRISNSGPVVRPAQVDTFTLLGTSSFENQTNAFFDGTSFMFRKAAALGETIANYKIVEIAGDYVTLGAVSNQTVQFYVGMQMRRADGGPWSLAPGFQPPVISDSVTNNSETQTNGTASSGAESDIIKRMMERRAKEK